MSVDHEEWRPWRVGAYEVSSLGRVRRAKPGRRTEVGRIVQPILMATGYLAVRPVVDGRNVQTYVHAMVAEVFIGLRPTGQVINHIDGNKANPRASNLEYVTHSGNMWHARATGLMKVGEDHGGAKLSDAQVAEMRVRRARGAAVGVLAREYGVAASTVSGIVNGKRRCA